MEIIQIDVGGFDKNFSYIVVGENNESVLIDPTGDLNKIIKVINEKKLVIVLQLLTHSHPDHIENVDYFLGKKISLKKYEDFLKEPEFIIANIKFKTLFTPGHTKDSVCFLVDGSDLITGDTLFVCGIGTTAYGGNDLELKDSLNYLHTLNKDLIIWPGHNYGGASSSLKEALSNSTIKPSEKVLNEIKKRVVEFEKNSNTKF